MKLTDLAAKLLAAQHPRTGALRIVQAGHPTLRAASAAERGQLPDEQLLELFEAMVHTMHDAPGVGVAAPQIGLPLRAVVMEDRVDQDEEDELGRSDLPLMRVLNPRYEAVPGSTSFGFEGCLSADGWRSIVPRPTRVRVSGTVVAQDGTRSELDEVWSGWKARIFQHEADHLDGILCHDRSVAKSMIREEYLPYYEDLADAAYYLRLAGPITELAPGSTELPDAGADH